jgi:aspartyl-tRNA(Asn)/glutamyl-tRNA(Gln) amidotransferase subunit A
MHRNQVKEELMKIVNTMELTITRLARHIRRRRLSPVDLTRSLLSRIEHLDPHLNSFITVTPDLALAQAKRAEKEISRGRYRGPLHGIPVCLKDLFYTAGILTSGGSKILDGFIPGENAPVVDRLFEAGAVLLGKTNLHEFAYGPTSINPHYGAVHNPWSVDRMAGGSSGGSAAAVAAGLAIASLGTDTGGSIRIPAAACGCVGLKPTYGRVPLYGVIPLANSLDHVGPISRSVEDAALMLEAIAGADPRDPHSRGVPGERFTRSIRKGLSGLRIGIPRQYFFDHIHREVRQNVQAAIILLEQEGAEVREVDLKKTGETAALAAKITASEALAYHHRWMKKRRAAYGADVRLRLEEGVGISALEYLLTQDLRRAYTREFETTFGSVDLLAVPTLPVAAPGLEESEVSVGRSRENVRLALLRFTRPGNLTGFPAITVPCGLTSDHLPAGMQLIGRRNEEETVLRAAYGYEQATPWHEMFPPDPPQAI